jgi:methylmalonyl-CoA/ethylmalonyl-CoA epimerase
VRLDHVALATRDASSAIATLVGDLGGTVLFGGESIGFRPMQVYLGDAGSGMKVEFLEPFAVEQNDFLERFLVRHGDGPHHLTFKVDDLEQTLEGVRAAGYTPVSVDLSDPTWKEAFLQPREAHGTVVQLAESDHKTTPLDDYAYATQHGVDANPQWWRDPPPRAVEPTTLRRIVLATPQLDTTEEFFSGLLGGEAWGTGDDPKPWIELAWPGAGRIRLELRDDRTPGIDRLELVGPGPRRELVVADTLFVINP